MGRIRRSRTHKSQRDIHRASRTRVRIVPWGLFQSFVFFFYRILTRLTLVFQARTRDLDQIQLIDLDPKVCTSQPDSSTRESLSVG